MNFKALLAEFIGTFAVVFIGIGAIVSDHVTNGAVGLTGIALAYGLAVAVMVSATSAVSGGHLNPAVSFGMMIAGHLPIMAFTGYVIAQCLGALAASSLLMSAMSPLNLEAVNYGIPVVGESATTGMACTTEIVLTFFLVFVMFGTAVDRRAPNRNGLYIGLTVVMSVLMGGPISGAALNPARWLGPAVISGDYAAAWVYWVGPLSGAALGSIAYTMFLQEKATAATNVAAAKE
ncbi:MAG: aquaporin [bacterium]|nr:aquaporin [bacterium]